MAAQLCWGPLSSTPAQAPVTSSAAAHTPLWTLRRTPLCGPLRPPSRGVFVPSPIFFGYMGGDAMAAAVAGAARLFAPARGKLLDILVKLRPPTHVTGRGAVNNSCAGDLHVENSIKTASSVLNYDNSRKC